MIKFANKQDFKIHVQGDKRLFNQYGITLINPTKCPNVKSKREKICTLAVVSKDSHRLNPTRSVAISYSSNAITGHKKDRNGQLVNMAAGSMLQLLPRLLAACPEVGESKFQTAVWTLKLTARQIENGQRCDLFISAHSTHTDALVKAEILGRAAVGLNPTVLVYRSNIDVADTGVLNSWPTHLGSLDVNQRT